MDHHIQVVKKLTNLLENRFRIFGLEFGLDPIVGLVFGAGDMVTLVVGLYYIWIGTQIGMPSQGIVRMIFNIVLDFVIGSIPILGDIFDFAFKAHTKNMQLIQQHYNNQLIQHLKKAS